MQTVNDRQKNDTVDYYRSFIDAFIRVVKFFLVLTSFRFEMRSAYTGYYNGILYWKRNNT